MGDAQVLALTGLESQTRTIGDAEWSLTTLPTTKALEVLTFIADVIGESGARLVEIARMFKQMTSEEDEEQSILDAPIDGRVFGEAVSALTGKLRDPRTVEVIKTMLSTLRKNGKQVLFDAEFAGQRLALIPPMVQWSMELNFSGFIKSDTVASLVSKAGHRFKAH